MTATVCAGCTRPVTDDAYLCTGCTGRLARDLGDLGALADELQTTRLRLARTGGAATGVLSRSADKPLPWNEKAAETADLLRGTVVAWVKVAVEDLGARLPTGEMPAMARTLLACLERFRHHVDAADLADEIAHVTTLARRTIDLAPERTYAGPCREEFQAVRENDDGDPEPDGVACCTVDLYVRNGSRSIVCRNCGMEHDVDTRHRWLLAIANDQLVTPAALSRFLTVHGEPVTAERIRKWLERGQLVAHGHDPRGRPLLNVGEAAALLTTMNTRRSA